MRRKVSWAEVTRAQEHQAQTHSGLKLVRRLESKMAGQRGRRSGRLGRAPAEQSPEATTGFRVHCQRKTVNHRRQRRAVSHPTGSVGHSVTPDSLQPHGLQSARLLCPWDPRILEWIAIPFSRGSSQTRDRTQVSCTASRFLTV